MKAEDDDDRQHCAISDAARAEKMKTDEQEMMEAAKIAVFAAQKFR